MIKTLTTGAAEVGLCLGDHLLEVNSQRCTSLSVACRLLQSMIHSEVQTWRPIYFTVQRPSSRKVLLSSDEAAVFAMQLAKDHHSQQVVVSHMTQKSIQPKQKLRNGDALLKIDGFPVRVPGLAIDLLLNRDSVVKRQALALVEVTSMRYYGESVGWGERAVSLYHSDASQGCGYLSLDLPAHVADRNLDFLSTARCQKHRRVIELS